MRRVTDVRCSKTTALASHHLLLLCCTQLDIDEPRQPCKEKPDVQALSQAPVQRDFNIAFVDIRAAERPGAQQTLDEFNGRMVNALSASASACLPQSRQAQRRPWIGDATLELIATRNKARAGGHLAREKILNGRIKGFREERQEHLAGRSTSDRGLGRSSKAAQRFDG